MYECPFLAIKLLDSREHIALRHVERSDEDVLVLRLFKVLDASADGFGDCPHPAERAHGCAVVDKRRGPGLEVEAKEAVSQTPLGKSTRDKCRPSQAAFFLLGLQVSHQSGFVLCAVRIDLVGFEIPGIGAVFGREESLDTGCESCIDENLLVWCAR